MYDKRIREEGAAARWLKLPKTSNPYRKAAMETDESILWEQAAEWKTGHYLGKDPK